MPRYERDFGPGYGRDFGRRRQSGPQFGGMRSDGWGSDWRSFPGEEGWLGEGYEGMPNAGFEQPVRRGSWDADRGSYGRFGPEQGFGSSRGGYGQDFRSPGGSFGSAGWQSQYPNRQSGYGGGWGDQSRGSRGGRPGSQSGGTWSRTRASEIMTQDPESVTPDTKISEVAQRMRDLDIGIVPVVEDRDNRRLQGIITDRDIAIRAIADGKDGNVSVGDCMTQNVRTVNKNDSMRDVMRVMRQEQIRRVPVVDREGRLVGIIAQADLAVDYAGDDRDREVEVGSVVERISEPARPERGSRRMAAQGRNRSESDQENE